MNDIKIEIGPNLGAAISQIIAAHKGSNAAKAVKEAFNLDLTAIAVEQIKANAGMIKITSAGDHEPFHTYPSITIS